MLVDDEENKFDGYINETEYTHQFIYPLIKEVLHDCDVKFRLYVQRLLDVTAS